MKIIIVRGGVVQGIYSDKAEEVHVVDYDGEDNSKINRYEWEVSELIKKHNLQEIY